MLQVLVGVITHYYSLTVTLPDGQVKILTFPTEQARDEYARTGMGEHGTVQGNFEKETQG